jgi:phosphohistidine swiveling domain-containing protein
VGDAAEKGLSIFSQTDKQVVEAFEKIAELITSKSEAKS